MKRRFDYTVNKLLTEAPVDAPVKPETKPDVKPATPRPSTPNPDPFRRRQPQTMPDIKPKAGGSGDLKSRLKQVLRKYSGFIKRS